MLEVSKQFLEVISERYHSLTTLPEIQEPRLPVCFPEIRPAFHYQNDFE